MTRWSTMTPQTTAFHRGRIRAQLQGQAGVYAIYHNAALVYVGKSHDLEKRLTGADHLSANWSRATWKIIPVTVLWKVRTERFSGERHALERRLIGRLRPPHNTLFLASLPKDGAK